MPECVSSGSGSSRSHGKKWPLKVRERTKVFQIVKAVIHFSMTRGCRLHCRAGCQHREEFLFLTKSDEQHSAHVSQRRTCPACRTLNLSRHIARNTSQVGVIVSNYTGDSFEL